MKEMFLGIEFDNDQDDEEANSIDSVDIFPYQVGGHHVIVRHPMRPDLIVKPLLPKEVQFYNDSKNDPNLQKVLSRYFGELNLPSCGNCIALEDLTFGMHEPCILDMKIGRRLYDDDATAEKKERMMKKALNSTSWSVGFRISGLRCLDPSNGHPILRLKRDVRELKVEDILPTIQGFFARLSRNDSLVLLNRYLERLEQIKKAVQGSNGHFYSSSVLFVYDHHNIEHWDCRMIDFVHSHIFPPSETIMDDNYLKGLGSLSEYLDQVVTLLKEEPPSSL